MSSAFARLPNNNSEQPTESVNTKLSLWFTSDRQLELIKTCFHSPLLPQPITAVRGKTAGAFSTTATFQWTSAVQALSILLLRAVERVETKRHSIDPLLEGGKGSLASSLDASLYKQTAWLDLFGATSRGDSMSRRVLTRTNPGRRRSGPVMIALNERILPANCIEVYLDNNRVKDGQQLTRFADTIEKAWVTEHDSLALVNPLRLYNPLKI